MNVVGIKSNHQNLEELYNTRGLGSRDPSGTKRRIVLRDIEVSKCVLGHLNYCVWNCL